MEIKSELRVELQEVLCGMETAKQKENWDFAMKSIALR